MKLYDYFRSSAAYRVRIALNLKGLAYERHEVHLVRDGGEHLKADYRAINPQARVPALELDDGTILTQSPAILEWIEETHPEPPSCRLIPFCVPASAPSPPSSPATSTQSTT
jgi:maleylacetoacetate isomerase